MLGLSSSSSFSAPIVAGAFKPFPEINNPGNPDLAVTCKRAGFLSLIAHPPGKDTEYLYKGLVYFLSFATIKGSLTPLISISYFPPVDFVTSNDTNFVSLPSKVTSSVSLSTPLIFKMTLQMPAPSLKFLMSAFTVAAESVTTTFGVMTKEVTAKSIYFGSDTCVGGGVGAGVGFGAGVGGGLGSGGDAGVDPAHPKINVNNSEEVITMVSSFNRINTYLL